MQSAGPAPQYSLAKSFPGFGPAGPLLVTSDEFEDPDSIELGCDINAEQVQKGNTSNMVFPVPEIIARLSKVTQLFPGDVELVTYMRGVGEMRHRMQASSTAPRWPSAGPHSR
ncbi:2-keto-4-pentenoate hydratase/2-oxohepta-3-ene-1,7-dioic acid hydratase in catechol pathway [Arthrobacter globiformis]|nr:2-keto-4-pentenoate hydratase/2-oxohepta-3-ene-1,7-dioic acid hydratase in catechol pathway [Arthrobacter globiformis]